MTTAPTAAELDAYADDSTNVAGIIYQDSAQNNGAAATFIMVGFTQNDSTINGFGIGDPTVDGQSALYCRGLVSEYTNILLREYTCSWDRPTSVNSTIPAVSFIADSTEQDRINDPANWVPAP